MKYFFCFCLLFIYSWSLYAASFTIHGVVKNETTGDNISGVTVTLEKSGNRTTTDSLGQFIFLNITSGEYKLSFKNIFFEKKTVLVSIKEADIELPVIFLKPFIQELSSVIIESNPTTFGVTRLKPVEGTAIYDGKKNEVIVMKDMNVSLATNSSRQIFSKVPGINIWESDAAGLQLGVAARGLDPNRTSNFNTRQNGYDMSADALGYPGELLRTSCRSS
ncbi:MAG: carboxypeptidase-like regulatory domain-containing protein [Bacteroidetes bacterium]|nr:carboxypeptidase-like regulatory domain-containing protein [Bacteroidota bacterium]